MLRVCSFFKRKELKSLEKNFSISDIIYSAKKVKNGIGTKIKGIFLPNTNIIKINLTGKGGAGRIIYLVSILKNKKIKYIYPLILCLKKNKTLGKNLSPQNKHFTQLIDKNLELFIQDYKNNDFEEYEI